MKYNDMILNETKKLIAEKKLNAVICDKNGGALLVVDGKELPLFTTIKLAKIYLENYITCDNINIDRNKSGIVSQKNDEALKKRRGRPKKADNDRTATV